MQTTQVSSGSDLLVTMSGPARIQEMAGATDDLKRVLSSTEPLLTVDLTGIEGADVTFFQALLALQLSLAQGNRHLLLKKLPADHPVVLAADLLGIRLDHHFNLIGDPQ